MRVSTSLRPSVTRRESQVCAGRDEATSAPRGCPTSCGPVAIAHGAQGLWERFDSAVETLAITMTGRDTVAVADGFRGMGDELLAVADELERDDSWRVGHEAG